MAYDIHRALLTVYSRARARRAVLYGSGAVRESSLYILYMLNISNCAACASDASPCCAFIFVNDLIWLLCCVLAKEM